MTMRNLLLVGVVIVGGVWGCGATNGHRGSTAADEAEGSDGDGRFQSLESRASSLGPETALELPEVAEEDELFVVEATLGIPEREEETGRATIEPPEAWTIGTTESGEEVRFEFLQPEGGAMSVVIPEALEAEEVVATFILRYSRRNLVLTEAGTSYAVHVVPMALRLDIEGLDPLYWIASEAGSLEVGE